MTSDTTPAYRGSVSTVERAESGQRLSTTLVLAIAAVGCALVAIFGEDGSFRAGTIAPALVGLVPWALEAAGVRVPPALFAGWSLCCAAAIVLWQGNPGGMFPVMVMVVWVLRETGDLRVTVPTIVVSGGLIIGLAIIDGSAHESGLFYFLGGIGISALSGLMLRRQELITAELAAMNELRVEHAAAEERARIARDVHDVVAHSLTVVMLHLTGARRALASDPQRADEALARAESVGRDSLDSIRQVMGLLREPGRDAVPGVSELPSLLEAFRTGGLTVDASLDEVRNVDPAAGLVVYRVVQESLTNALRHAPGAVCTVALSDSDNGTLVVTVRNGPGPGAAVSAPEGRAGQGVRGMAERVRTLGGDLTAGRTTEGGWQVVATIPRRGRAQVEDRDGARLAWPQPTAH